MSFITAIGTAVPPNQFEQGKIAGFMERVMQLDYADGRKLKTIFSRSGIRTRHSVLEDYGRLKDFDFYPNTDDFEPFPTTEKRMLEYQKHALPLSVAAIQDCLQHTTQQVQDITHLIVVSCTGMYAPGLDIDLVKSLNLRKDVNRTGINFMGCYAAFNALKVADAICRSDTNARVLIVCVELCTLHFQKQATEDNMLANALFADGAAALLISPAPRSGCNLSLEGFHNALAFNGIEHMAWDIGNLGFEMKLSTYVPDVIRSGIKTLTATLLEKLTMEMKDVSHIAIHPGGKKILVAIEQELGVTREQNSPAYTVLEKFGNMSSATIVFVLRQIIDRLKERYNNKLILSFAFGPGLTLESMMLKIHYR
ncbi:MAG: type III polyketide synthase [Cyclobacteriaceae bacterium]|nr:type III polyketide synthase [Cyclobacteriaceae bacterium]